MPKMGADNLKASLSNPARVYLWEVIIPNVLGGGADPEDLLVRCQSTNIPGRQQGQIVVPYKQTAGIVYPGKLAYGGHTWQSTFVEGEDKVIHDFVYNWQQIVVSDRDGVGNGDENVKADILLSMVTTKGDEYMRIKLFGCYPQEIGDVALSYDTEAMIMYPVTFAFDRWERQV